MRFLSELGRDGWMGLIEASDRTWTRVVFVDATKWPDSQIRGCLDGVVIPQHVLVCLFARLGEMTSKIESLMEENLMVHEVPSSSSVEQVLHDQMRLISSFSPSLTPSVFPNNQNTFPNPTQFASTFAKHILADLSPSIRDELNTAVSKFTIHMADDVSHPNTYSLDRTRNVAGVDAALVWNVLVLAKAGQVVIGPEGKGFEVHWKRVREMAALVKSAAVKLSGATPKNPERQMESAAVNSATKQRAKSPAELGEVSDTSDNDSSSEDSSDSSDIDTPQPTNPSIGTDLTDDTPGFDADTFRIHLSSDDTPIGTQASPEISVTTFNPTQKTTYVTRLAAFVQQHYPSTPAPSYKQTVHVLPTESWFRCRVTVAEEQFESAYMCRTADDAAESAARLACLFMHCYRTAALETDKFSGRLESVFTKKRARDDPEEDTEDGEVSDSQDAPLLDSARQRTYLPMLLDYATKTNRTIEWTWDNDTTQRSHSAILKLGDKTYHSKFSHSRRGDAKEDVAGVVCMALGINKNSITPSTPGKVARKKTAVQILYEHCQRTNQVLSITFSPIDETKGRNKLVTCTVKVGDVEFTSAKGYLKNTDAKGDAARVALIAMGVDVPEESTSGTPAESTSKNTTPSSSPGRNKRVKTGREVENDALSERVPSTPPIKENIIRNAPAPIFQLPLAPSLTNPNPPPLPSPTNPPPPQFHPPQQPPNPLVPLPPLQPAPDLASMVSMLSTMVHNAAMTGIPMTMPMGMPDLGAMMGMAGLGATSSFPQPPFPPPVFSPVSPMSPQQPQHFNRGRGGYGGPGSSDGRGRGCGRGRGGARGRGRGRGQSR
ncbi:hypothetical protein DFS34DRAFT_682887 [Phlyctochytrium arcticum]|nr:hypothetical protein DFS34DRAFT_682887 [Phlyctochytrium arcticum]